MRKVVGVVLGIAAVAAGCGGGGGGVVDSATAIVPPYADNFDDATALDGWLFYNPADSSTPPSPTVPTLWHVGATPASMPGGPFYSSPHSLCYNNGTNYDTGATNTGAAISPKFDIGGMSSPVVAFWCNYATETTGTSYDQRWVKIGYISSSGSPVYFYEEQLSTTPGAATAGPCSAMGTWHQHVIAMDPAWGKIRIAFLFDTIDAYDNDHPGWFVDDFQVTEASALLSSGSGSSASGGSGTSSGGTSSSGSSGSGTSSGSGSGTSGGSSSGGTSTSGSGTSSGGTSSGSGSGTSSGTSSGGTTTGGTSSGGSSGSSSGTTSSGTTSGGASGGSSAGTTGGTSGGGATGGSGTTIVLYSTDFDSSGATSGWTLGTTGVHWKVDGLPSTVPGGASHSGTSSLNYNNTANYDDGTANSGSALSPPVTISAATGVKLRYWCNYVTRTTGLDLDKRFVKVHVVGATTPVLVAEHCTVGASPFTSNCAAMGTWHQHEIALDSTWGTIQVEFFFDKGDAAAVNHEGWFVDDFQIVGTPAGSGSVPAATADALQTQDTGPRHAPHACFGSVSGSSSGGTVFGWAALSLLVLVSTIGIRRVRHRNPIPPTNRGARP